MGAMFQPTPHLPLPPVFNNSSPFHLHERLHMRPSGVVSSAPCHRDRVPTTSPSSPSLFAHRQATKKIQEQPPAVQRASTCLRMFVHSTSHVIQSTDQHLPVKHMKTPGSCTVISAVVMSSSTRAVAACSSTGICVSGVRLWRRWNG